MLPTSNQSCFFRSYTLPTPLLPNSPYLSVIHVLPLLTSTDCCSTSATTTTTTTESTGFPGIQMCRSPEIDDLKSVDEGLSSVHEIQSSPESQHRSRKKLTKASTCATDSPTKEKITPLFTQWTPRNPLSLEESICRMWKNAQKTLLEHLSPGYFPPSESFHPYSFIQALKTTKLSYSFLGAHTEIGHRQNLEDSYFCQILDDGNLLTGIFDGHSGNEVAHYCSEKFKNKFCQKLHEQNGLVYSAFEHVFYEIHNEVTSSPSLKKAGCTAVVSFIDLLQRNIYTATLGGCEATIYRKFSCQLKFIPLSCVRNWGSKQDIKKISIAYPQLKKKCSDSRLSEKSRRYPSHTCGLNVNRVIGDVGYELEESPILSHKPKITVQKILENDFIILACNGLKKVTTEKKIINQINLLENSHTEDTISKTLAQYAINEEKSSDNITVMAIKILKSS